MAHGGPASLLRPGATVLAAALLAVGCTDGDGGGDPGGGSDAKATASQGGGTTGEGGGAAGPGTGAPSDGGSGVGGTSPIGPAPKSRKKALKLARQVVAKPPGWGVGFVPDSTYKGGPDTTAELGKDCVWTQRPLRASEVVSITRRSVLPAGDGKGPVHVAAVVTVYRDETSAKWDMARTLEEPLRCPDQRLNATERVTGLGSAPVPARLRMDSHHDVIYETGEIRGNAPGGPYRYTWGRSRVGSVIVSASVKGAQGYDKDQLGDVSARGEARMRAEAERQLGVSK